MDDYEEAILFTFALLESRLGRLEFVLGGEQLAEGHRSRAIPDRIRRIEKSLQQLAGKTTLLNETNELLSKHKDIFKPQHDLDADSPLLDTPQKAVVVIERATGFATVASQLKALDDQQIPSTDGFAKLAVLRPRSAQAEARQLQQALKISELRRRNALVNQRYKQIMLLGTGKCWIEYHERLTRALRTMVREEFKRKSKHEETEETEEL